MEKDLYTYKIVEKTCTTSFFVYCIFTFVLEFPIDVYTYRYYTKHIDNYMATKPDFAQMRSQASSFLSVLSIPNR